MKEFLKETLNTVLNTLSENDTINNFLLHSVKYVEWLMSPEAGTKLLYLCGGMILFLFVDLVYQLYKHNFFSSFFSFVFLLVFCSSFYLINYFVEAEKNEVETNIVELGIPDKKIDKKHSVEYVYGKTSYIINKLCSPSLNEKNIIHNTSREFSYFNNIFDLNCLYTKIDKDKYELEIIEEGD